MNETQELLHRAVLEINSLRRSNELMSAKLEMFDNVMSALHGQPAANRRGGMSPDLVWEIEKHLREFTEQANPFKKDNG